jgi:hypothetical protein
LKNDLLLLDSRHQLLDEGLPLSRRVQKHQQPIFDAFDLKHTACAHLAHLSHSDDRASIPLDCWKMP